MHLISNTYPHWRTLFKVHVLLWQWQYSGQAVKTNLQKSCTTYPWCRWTPSEPSCPNSLARAWIQPPRKHFWLLGWTTASDSNTPHPAGLKPGGAEVCPQDLLQENQTLLNSSFWKHHSSFKRGQCVGMRLFWQVVPCDKAKVLLLVQLVCCSWHCTLQKCSLPATNNCKIYFMWCCSVHFKSGTCFCFLLKSIIILTKLSKIWYSISPIFASLQSFFLFWGVFWMPGYETPSPQSSKVFLKNTSLYLVPSYHNNNHLRNTINIQSNRILLQSPLTFFPSIPTSCGIRPQNTWNTIFSLHLQTANTEYISFLTFLCPDFLKTHITVLRHPLHPTPTAIW